MAIVLGTSFDRLWTKSETEALLTAVIVEAAGKATPVFAIVFHSDKSKVISALRSEADAGTGKIVIVDSIVNSEFVIATAREENVTAFCDGTGEIVDAPGVTGERIDAICEIEGCVWLVLV